MPRKRKFLLGTVSKLFSFSHPIISLTKLNGRTNDRAEAKTAQFGQILRIQATITDELAFCCPKCRPPENKILIRVTAVPTFMI
jgi:hypothetical protein